MKKLLIVVAGLAVLVVGGLLFVWSNLDGIVKDSIQSYGSAATQTQVRVADVKLELESGKASISGLTVANPVGFNSPNIFAMDKITTKIDVSTIRQNPIVIDEIIIHAPVVVYEINKSGLSNVDVLKKQLGISAAKSGSNQSDATNDGGDELKMIIRKLVVEGGKAKVRIAALGNTEQTVNLPRIQLTDVGKKSGGATAAEVAQLLSSKLLGNVKSSVAALGVSKFLGKSTSAFSKGAAGAVGKVGGAIGSGTSGASGAAGDAMKGLFGK